MSISPRPIPDHLDEDRTQRFLEDEHRRAIELIFAQACADALRDTAENLLCLNDNDERQRAAEAHGAAFASAFVLMSRYFTASETHPKPQQRSDSASCSG